MNHSIQENRLKRLEIYKLIIFLSIITSGLVILLKVDNMMLSFLLAFVIKYSLSPIINLFERRGISTEKSTLIVFAIAFTAFCILIYWVSPFISAQIKAFQSEVPRYIEGTKSLIFDIESKIEVLINTSIELNLGAQAEGLMISWTKSIFEDLPNFLSKSLTTLLLAPFFAYFLLKDGRSISKWLLDLVPNSFFELVLSLQHQINDQMGQFIRARLLEATIVGVLVWGGLSLIGFPFSHLLAIFAALTNLIPYLGPVIGAIPAIIIALINGVSIFPVIGVYAFAQLMDMLFIIPLVVAKIVNLHPITVVIAIIIGAQLMGVVGMLVSIPAASVIKVTAHSVYHHLINFRA